MKTSMIMAALFIVGTKLLGYVDLSDSLVAEHSNQTAAAYALLNK